LVVIQVFPWRNVAVLAAPLAFQKVAERFAALQHEHSYRPQPASDQAKFCAVHKTLPSRQFGWELRRPSQNSA
jgi:hypothetical protein